jgi:hypothetical protein
MPKILARSFKTEFHVMAWKAIKFFFHLNSSCNEANKFISDKQWFSIIILYHHFLSLDQIVFISNQLLIIVSHLWIERLQKFEVINR